MVINRCVKWNLVVTRRLLTLLPICDLHYAWFTFSSPVLFETFGEMWMRQNTYECRHSHARARIIDNEARHSRHSFSLWLWTIYQHVSESFETRWKQVESVEDETNVPFTLSFLSCRVLSQQECKPGIRINQSECTPLLSHKRDQPINTSQWNVCDVLVINLWSTCDQSVTICGLIVAYLWLCIHKTLLQIAWNSPENCLK